MWKHTGDQPLDEPITFHDSLQHAVISTVRERFIFSEFSPATLKSMRESIKECVRTHVESRSLLLGEAAVTWLTDQFFKRLRVNAEQLIADLVVINEWSVRELAGNDIITLSDLLRGSPLEKEIERQLLPSSQGELS